MAMIDYGAIAFKNGECIQTDFFGDMEKMVGYKNELDGNFFSYLGDKDLTVCFYKCMMKIHFKSDEDKEESFEEWFNCSGFVKWKLYEKYIFTNCIDKAAHIKVKNLGHNYFLFTMDYNGDKYKCIFGYGVDFPYYKKTKRYNYYRSIGFLMKDFFYNIKNNLIYDIKSWFYIRMYKIINKK